MSKFDNDQHHDQRFNAVCSRNGIKSEFSVPDLVFNEVHHNGSIEVSELTDIDVAFANKIGSVLERLIVSDPESSRKKRLAAFTRRPLHEKIAMGEFNTPLRFLRALSKQGKDKIVLPCLYITRDPTIAFAELDQYIDVEGVSELYNSADQYIGQIDQSLTTLSYQINIVGWQNDNIEAIALLLLMWLRHKNHDHRFTAKTLLGGSNYELSAEIVDRQSVTADNASLPFDDDKMRVLSLTINVNAEVAVVRYGHVVSAHIKGESNIVGLNSYE